MVVRAKTIQEQKDNMNRMRASQWIEPFKTIPNQLTAVRLVLIPVMWFSAFARAPLWIGVGLIVALISDALDGYLARRLNMVSEFGARLDSLADLILTLSAVLWILMLRPEVIADNLAVLAIAAILYLTALGVGWIKFGPLADLSLYSAKLAGLTEYLFLIHTFLTVGYNQTVFTIAAGSSLFSCAETLLLRFVQSKTSAPTRSLVLLVKEAFT